MRTHTFFKVAVLSGLLALSGCASKVAAPDQYSGFLKDYSGLQEMKSATGKPTLRWVDPSYNEANYDSIIWTPITYYPTPKPTTQLGQKTLDELLNYTNTKLKTAIGQRKPIVTTPGKHSLIFRGAITGVSSDKEGLQFYEVVPVALLVAGTQMATGHRTMDTHLFFEGELIDAATNKPVIKVVRKGEGKELANENTPMGFGTLKQVVDDMATDATMLMSIRQQNNKKWPAFSQAVFLCRPQAAEPGFRLRKHHHISPQNQQQADDPIEMPHVTLVHR
ncbi:DUF3313 domain-containing protein [Enterobacter intestinihominis]